MSLAAQILFTGLLAFGFGTLLFCMFEKVESYWVKLPIVVLWYGGILGMVSGTLLGIWL